MILELEEWYHWLDQSAEFLAEDLEISYLEGLLETIENLNDEGAVLVENGRPRSEIVEELKKIYQQVLDQYEETSPELIRQAIQLCLLKGMKSQAVQSNHQMTPDSIGSLVGFLLEIVALPRLDNEGQTIRMADLATGTGNLLLTIHHYLTAQKDLNLSLTGVDNDDLLLALASASAAFQKTPVQWFYQDGLTPILMDPVHMVVSDLPVGYYPDQKNSKNYTLSFEDDELAYSHFLLTEQHLNYLMPGGFGAFVVPATIFEDERGSDLLAYLQEESFLLAMIQLPKDFFASEAAQKAIMLVQKKSSDSQQEAPEVFIGAAPNFKNVDQMKHFLNEVIKWNQQF